MKLTPHQGSPGVLIPLDSPNVKAAARAIEHGFGRRPVFVREGGSIPIVATFHKTFGADTLLVGWGQDDDGAHGPNEKFLLADFHRGMRASARLWEELSRVGK
jgi:succinyl-diaminopimelate desuccinylase